MELKTQISSIHGGGRRVAVMVLAITGVSRSQILVEQQQSLDKGLHYERAVPDNGRIPLQQTFNEMLIALLPFARRIVQQQCSPLSFSPINDDDLPVAFRRFKESKVPLTAE